MRNVLCLCLHLAYCAQFASLTLKTRQTMTSADAEGESCAKLYQCPKPFAYAYLNEVGSQQPAQLAANMERRI